MAGLRRQPADAAVVGHSDEEDPEDEDVEDSATMGEASSATTSQQPGGRQLLFQLARTGVRIAIAFLQGGPHWPPCPVLEATACVDVALGW